jgi:hypothetical protein
MPAAAPDRRHPGRREPVERRLRADDVPARGRAVFGAVTVWSVGLLVLSALASVILGIALARAYLAALARIEDNVAGTVLGFLSTFGVWILADALELSAVLTTVFYALTLARPTSERMGARRRRTSFASGRSPCLCSTCWHSWWLGCSCAASCNAWTGMDFTTPPSRWQCWRPQSSSGWSGSPASTWRSSG